MKAIVKPFAFLAVLAIVSPAAAQDRRTASDQDVITQPTIPAPEPGQAIILNFGQTSQVYFKYPFKAVRLADPLAVSAAPMTDHIIALTGLAPGTSQVTLEAPDGKISSYGVVTVVRAPHEVKVYMPAPKDKGGDFRGSNVIFLGNGPNNVKESDEAEYKSLLCNEIGCQPVPKPK